MTNEMRELKVDELDSVAGVRASELMKSAEIANGVRRFCGNDELKKYIAAASFSATSSVATTCRRRSGTPSVFFVIASIAKQSSVKVTSTGLLRRSRSSQ